jgi:hypothetical protein
MLHSSLTVDFKPVLNSSTLFLASSESKVTQESVTNRHAEITAQCEQCVKTTQETENQLQKVCRLQEYMMITRSHLEVYCKSVFGNTNSLFYKQNWQKAAN